MCVLYTDPKGVYVHNRRVSMQQEAVNHLCSFTCVPKRHCSFHADVVELSTIVRILRMPNL